MKQRCNFIKYQKNKKITKKFKKYQKIKNQKNKKKNRKSRKNQEQYQNQKITTKNHNKIIKKHSKNQKIIKKSQKIKKLKKTQKNSKNHQKHLKNLKIFPKNEKSKKKNQKKNKKSQNCQLRSFRSHLGIVDSNFRQFSCGNNRVWRCTSSTFDTMLTPRTHSRRNCLLTTRRHGLFPRSYGFTSRRPPDARWPDSSTSMSLGLTSTARSTLPSPPATWTWRLYTPRSFVRSMAPFHECCSQTF